MDPVGSRRTERAAPVTWWSVVLLGLVLVVLAVPAPAEEEVAQPPPPVEEEPELTGEELKAHRKAVRDIVKALDSEKNRVLVAGEIERLGAEGSRVSRDALIEFTDGNKNQEYIDKAFQALAKIGGTVALEFLCGTSALRSRDFLVQQSAAQALAKVKDERATAALLDVLTGKRTKIEIIGACALAVAQSAPEDPRVRDVLFEYASHRKDTIRSNCLEALGYLATDEVIERLRDALMNDGNTRARGAAAKGMEHTKRRECIPYLQEALAADKSMTVKNACMNALQALEKH
jgi:HEAT repeat protein